MNKKEQNNYDTPILVWLAHFIPHICFTPRLLLQVTGKKDCQNFNRLEHHTMKDVPVNMMESDVAEIELSFRLGNVQDKVLTCIYALVVCELFII